MNSQERNAYGKAYRQAHKEEAKAYNKAWYQAHKEEAKASMKVWREAHKEEAKEYMKAYYEAHKDQYKASMKAWYEAHKEEAIAKKKAYNEAHKEEAKEYMKAYYEAHKEEAKAYQKAYKQSDVNALGQTKHSIRMKSNNYLKKSGIKIPGYQIHHCCTYAEPYKFIYCSKEMHRTIHSYLKAHNIDADSDHYDYIKHLLDESVVKFNID